MLQHIGPVVFVAGGFVSVAMFAGVIQAFHAFVQSHGSMGKSPSSQLVHSTGSLESFVLVLESGC